MSQEREIGDLKGHADRRGERIRFGPYLLDESAGALYCGGEPVRVEPKPMQLLRLLASRRPALVSFDEIREALWPGVSVSPAARNRIVSLARQAVGDDGQRQIAIRTLRGRGLSFIARTQEFDPENPGSARAPSESFGDEAPLVGRDRVLAALLGEVEAVLRGSGGVVVLEGEAGIGKTRLAQEVGTHARRLGVRVHWSTSAADPEEAGPFWVWRQILGSLTRELMLEAAPGPLARSLEELSPLLPGWSGAASETVPAPVSEDVLPIDDARARARLLDAASEVLTAAARQSPRLLIVDDLHWADAESLRLTRLLAPGLPALPLLLVVTWREGGERYPEFDALRRSLGRIQRQRIRLRGLARADVAHLLRRALGCEPAEPLVAALHERSDGNPFFVNEMTRLLCDRIGDGSAWPERMPEIEVPDSIGLVLEERLAHVSAECRELLELAAVIGREPELHVLIEAAGWGEAEANDRIAEAMAAGLLERVAGRSEVVRFSHALLVEHLQAPDNPLIPAWHWAVADALETFYAARPECWGEIARHRCRGVAMGLPATAVAAARRAADHAMALRAYGEAALHLSAALENLDRAPGATDRLRGEFLLDLGRCQIRAGHRDEAVACFDEAANLARRSRLDDLLARAALGFSGLASTLVGDHKPQLDRVLEALGRLDSGEASLRARLLSRHASIRAALGDHTAAEGLAQQAVALARSTRDPATLASTMRARNAVLAGDVLRAEERIAHADESLRFAEQAGDEELALDSVMHRAVARLHRGEAHRFRHDMSQYLARARELRHPLLEYFGTLAEVNGMILAGRFEAAERRAEKARALGVRAEHPDSGLYFSIQIAQLRYLQYRLHEFVDPLEAIGRDNALLGIRVALALAYAEAGRDRQARSLLQPLLDAFESGPRDSGWLSNVSLLALVAERVADVAAAERLSALLEPYAHAAVTAFLVSCNGSAAYFLGILAKTRGRHAEACAHFEAARTVNDAMGALPWLLRANLALADSLAGTGRERDRLRGLQLAQNTEADARAQEMWPLARRAETLVEQLVAQGRDLDPSEA